MLGYDAYHVIYDDYHFWIMKIFMLAYDDYYVVLRKNVVLQVYHVGLRRCSCWLTTIIIFTDTIIFNIL